MFTLLLPRQRRNVVTTNFLNKYLIKFYSKEVFISFRALLDFKKTSLASAPFILFVILFCCFTLFHIPPHLIICQQ